MIWGVYVDLHALNGVGLLSNHFLSHTKNDVSEIFLFGLVIMTFSCVTLNPEMLTLISCVTLNHETMTSIWKTDVYVCWS